MHPRKHLYLHLFFNTKLYKGFVMEVKRGKAYPEQSSRVGDLLTCAKEAERIKVVCVQKEVAEEN